MVGHRTNLTQIPRGPIEGGEDRRPNPSELEVGQLMALYETTPYVNEVRWSQARDAVRPVIEEETAAEWACYLLPQSSGPLDQLAHQYGWIERRVAPKGATLQRARSRLLPDQQLTFIQKR